MISAAEALAAITGSVHPLEPVTCGLLEANGMALAADVVAHEDIPPFDNAAMDGYAVHEADTGREGVTLRLAGEVPAGTPPGFALRPGETAAIMTGAMLPAGTSAVVQQEWTAHDGQNHVKVLRAVQPGHNVRPHGADIARGSTVLAAGTVLHAAETGVLASLGQRFVAVCRRPRVAIVATGSEVTSVEAPPAPAKIRNSNSYTLAAAVAEAGGSAEILGIAPDEPEALRTVLAAGLRSDMLVTSGGVSVGKYDLVIGALTGLGVEVKFWKVNIKPGMPLFFGMQGRRPVFGLPGNPVSSLVTFLRFVKPALRKMLGDRDAGTPLALSAELLHDIEKHDGKRHFVRGILARTGATLTVRSTGSQVSNVLTSLARANCLIILPESQTLFRAGERVEVELL